MGRDSTTTALCILAVCVGLLGPARAAPATRIEVSKSDDEVKTLTTKLEKLKSLLEEIVHREKPGRVRALESSMSRQEAATPPNGAIKPAQEVPTPPAIGVANATASPNFPSPLRGQREGSREGVETGGRKVGDEEVALHRLAEGLNGGEKTAFDSLIRALTRLLTSGQGGQQLSEDMDDLGKLDTTGAELGHNRAEARVKGVSTEVTEDQDVARLLAEIEKDQAQSKASDSARKGAVSRIALQKVEYSLLRDLYQGLAEGVTLQDILDDLHKTEQDWTEEKEIEEDLGKLVRLAGSRRR